MEFVVIMFVFLCGFALGGFVAEHYVQTHPATTTLPIVTTSRNQTVINNGEVVITASDAGSVDVSQSGNVTTIVYTRET